MDKIYIILLKKREKVSIIIPQVPIDLVVEHFRLIFTIETELGVFTAVIYSLLLLLLLPDSSCLFLPSFVPLRSLITETCSSSSTVAKIRSQNGLGQKCLPLCQESHAWFSFSRDPSPYLLTQRLWDNEKRFNISVMLLSEERKEQKTYLKQK